MNIKQTAIKSVLAGGLLIGGGLAGFVWGTNANEANAEQQLAMMKQQQAHTISKMNQITKQMGAYCEPVAVETISETFQITALRGNEIWGEPANGLGGEGIYYTQTEFDVFGVKPKLGDYVVMTWSYEAVANSEWEVIEHIELLTPMPTK